MRAPTIHLNGSSKEKLLNDVVTAHNAVRAAVQAVIDIEVHGRDYYVQPDPTAYQQARDEHLAMVAKLNDIQEELMELALAIQSQGRQP